ncbi:hypothetical protein TNCT_233021 [Trichonephila clavata]|uniref:Uncharacterized protein n=1 Tax=Trichonephila clavata TaxID=2740835 RepID=A0A8X6ILU5_TRICU|nr:hypothetical protein TNCT_233021 [Trichonephila clavata]
MKSSVMLRNLQMQLKVTSRFREDDRMLLSKRSRLKKKVCWNCLWNSEILSSLMFFIYNSNGLNSDSEEGEKTWTEWNEVESDGFFTTGMTTQQTAPWENWHLERGFKLLMTFVLVRWGLGGSGHVEGTGEKLSFASQAAR